MTDDDLRGLFKFGLTKLDTDEFGLTITGNNPADLKTVMVLCAAVKAANNSADNLQVLHWHHLACLTEDLVQAWGTPNPDIAKQWELARGELLAQEMLEN